MVSVYLGCRNRVVPNDNFSGGEPTGSNSEPYSAPNASLAAANPVSCAAMSENHLSETRFSDLPLHEKMLAGVQATGFEYCTPIQALTLPFALEGKDVAGQAQTGTGKTAAFLVATFNYLLTHPASENRRKNQPRAIMLAPTRELAVQIHKDAVPMAEAAELSLGLAFGGTDYEKQRNILTAGVDILIGTPGRIIDYFKQHVFDLKAIQVMVLDEADRMFDLGFIRDIRYLLRRMPAPDKRLGLLFSATLSMRVAELAFEHMNSPEQVRVETENVTADKVIQRVYFTANEEKIPLLIELLREESPERSIVFVNTKRAAERVGDYLKANGIEARTLSGDVPQPKRLRLLQDFQAGILPVLVATDVAARGLHIPEVSHVFNYDMPQDAEDYVHRIGRTARLGATGDAISFACEDYAFHLPEVEEYIGNKIPVADMSAYDLTKELNRPPRRPRKKHAGGRGGPRRGGGGRRDGNRGGRGGPSRR